MLISTDYEDELLALRKVITAEANKRLQACGSEGMASNDLAAWLIDEHRDCVIAALGCCIADALQRDEDENKMRDLVGESELSPEGEALVGFVRRISETLGLPQWYLARLTWAQLEPLSNALLLVLKLRSEISQTQLDAMQELEDRIAPVIDAAEAAGLPEPNLGEALKLLDQQTAETLRKLEPDDV